MKKVLVIDDDIQIRKLLKAIIQKEGYNCHVAKDVEAGFKCISENNFDLIITDLVLPDEDGLEVIKEICNQKKHPKIIAISGSKIIDKNLYLEIAQEIGADAYISKPFKVDALRKKINELI